MFKMYPKDIILGSANNTSAPHKGLIINLSIKSLRNQICALVNMEKRMEK